MHIIDLKKFYSIFLASSLLTLSPIEKITYGNSSESIKITMNYEGVAQFRFTYYNDKNIANDYYEDKEIYDVNFGDIIEVNIDKKYPKVIIEACFEDELISEAVLYIDEIKNMDNFEVLITDEELEEYIDIEYIYKEGNEPIEVKNLKNHYKFNPLNKYMLPKIIELDKLKIQVDEYYLSKGYENCYLLLNHGLKGSDFKKSEEDFYKIPLNCDYKEGSLIFSLSNDYYYDFNKGVMTTKKGNNSVAVKDIILSKNDSLVSEAYLIIEKFGYYEKRFQLDLLLEEKPLFGKNGYYTIEKLS